MGTNTLTTGADGAVIPASIINQYKTALNENVVPRNSGGAATDIEGDLGTSSLRWKNAYIQKIIVGLASSNVSIEEASSVLSHAIDGTVREQLGDSTKIVNVTDNHSFQINGTEKLVVDNDGADGQYLKAGSVATAAVADGAVTRAKTTSNHIESASCGTYTNTTAGAWETVTNFTVAITTSGNPVLLTINPFGVAPLYSQANNSFTATFMRYERDGGSLGRMVVFSGGSSFYPTSMVDFPPAGVHTYKFQNYPQVGSNFFMENLKFSACEL